jgi:diacylglycerol kinase family enzyme
MPATADLLEQLAASTAPGGAIPSRRALVIVNPYATTVSDRLKNLVLYALRGRYDVEARETEAPRHATDICREAAHEGYDVVIAFGGDGTVSEAADGLAGSPTPLTCLPGGSTNVYCRLLGIPTEIVDATEHLLRIADSWEPWAVDIGRVNGRHFVFAAGLGLDATVVRRVDAHPRLKARLGEYYFTYAAVTTFARRYLGRPPRVELTLPDGAILSGVTAIVQNAHPYTFFGRRPVAIAEGATLHSHTLAGAVLRRASPLDAPSLMRRALSRRARLLDHRQVDGFSSVRRVEARSLDGRPLPLHVDGDYQGEVERASFEVLAGQLLVVA